MASRLLSLAACLPCVNSWVATGALSRWTHTPPRARVPSMFEAYGALRSAPPHPARLDRGALGADLVPVMDCLKLPDMDAVNACFDSLSPWLQARPLGVGLWGLRSAC